MPGTGHPISSRPPWWRHHVDEHFGESLRRFCAEHVTPIAAHIDREDVYPVALVEQASRAGYTTVTLAEAYGGRGGSSRNATCVMEELSYGSAALGISLITIFQAQTIIERYGADSLKDAVLPRFGEGLPASFALTESARGSDIRHVDTRAVRTGDGWTITGEKSFITSGSAAQLFVVLAETDAGPAVFAIFREDEGVSTFESQDAHTFGLRNGPHVNLVLEGVRLPADRLIGEDGRGLQQAMFTLSNSRTLAAAISLGIARAAFDGAATFAASRQAFGQSVLDFQGIQWYFADAATKIDAARLLAYQAADDLDSWHEIARSTSEAKLYASAIATEVASMAVQVCGARGTMESTPFGRYLRDAKAYEIAGGSSEVLKNTIAKALRKTFSADDS